MGRWFGCPVMSRQVSIIFLIIDIIFGPFGVIFSACADLNGYNGAVAAVGIVEMFLTSVSFGYTVV